MQMGGYVIANGQQCRLDRTLYRRPQQTCPCQRPHWRAASGETRSQTCMMRVPTPKRDGIVGPVKEKPMPIGLGTEAAVLRRQQVAGQADEEGCHRERHRQLPTQFLPSHIA